jgi:transposase
MRRISGGRRKGKRGRGAAGKSVVFGLLERDGRVYTKVVENVIADNLMTLISALKIISMA